MYINGVLKQINEGIQVTNIETYIAQSEAIIEEIRSRNFTEANANLKEDVEEAEMSKVQSWKNHNNKMTF